MIRPISTGLITGENRHAEDMSMKKSFVLILAGLVCIMMIAAGCTGTSGTPPATPTVTTATATTVVPTEATTAPAPAVSSWSGTWNTSYSSVDYGQVIEVLSLTQVGSSVTGTYSNGNGTVNATIQENRLAGTWSESDDTGDYAGLFEFTLSADKDSFTGKWVSAPEGPDAVANSTETWNGVRIVSPTPSWSGDWNTSYSSTEFGQVVEVLTLTQTGSLVKGIYHNGNGTVNATVQESRLTGTWSDKDEKGNYAGLFEFTLSADKNSFAGRWVSASEGINALANSTETWNGVRI